MLTQTASSLDPVLYERLLSGLGHLERNARDLQQSVMSIRMMPMDYVFSRFPRLIRDLSAKLGKQVQLVTVGKETELDKSLIERIIDPITHLVRNSLDHGIETPAQRVLAGKEPSGQLTLSAQHHGGSIVIEVKDDGGGLAREKILAKARQQGITISENASYEDVWLLIMAPGFSTAEAVTDVSGRGVGMDVVKRNIQEMGGHIEIASVQGKGTTIRIVLPLTLAILNGMSVRVGSETYILPLNYVIDRCNPGPRTCMPSPLTIMCCVCAASTWRWSRCTGFLPWPMRCTTRRRPLSSSCKPRDRVLRCWSTSWSASSRWWSRILKPTTARCRAFPPPPSWATAM
jgi:two-component system chemotaxis sensor kinase CheA